MRGEAQPQGSIDVCGKPPMRAAVRQSSACSCPPQAHRGWDQTYPRGLHTPHSTGIHFQNQGEFPYLLYPVPHPAPFVFILLCLEETPTNQEPAPERTRPSQTLPRLPLCFQEKIHWKKKKYLVYTKKTELSGEMGIFYPSKQLLKQKAARLLVFLAALFILTEELNSCKE